MPAIIWVISTFAFVMLSAMPSAAVPTFMSTHGLTSQPIGHYEYCKRYRHDCQSNPIAPAAYELTPEIWRTMVRINVEVNHGIRQVTDLEAWGKEEWWEYPVNGMGDCDDLVLEKRRRLAEAGIPLSNLLITIVLNKGEGHAVLSVNTALGDFILDNLHDRVLPWQDTDFTYLKRQSPSHSGQWHHITPHQDLLVSDIN